MLEKKQNVAIYVRVSTDKQEALNQLIQLRDYATKSNYKIFNEYIDVISGKENSRPNYDLMFKHAHMKYFDIVLFWDLSRFSRSGTLFTLQKLKELENIGIDFISFQEPYINTLGHFKDVAISMLSSVAKIEREKISQRTKAGLERARQQGKQIGKRGKDKKPRKIRADRGIKRGISKNMKTLLKIRHENNN